MSGEETDFTNADNLDDFLVSLASGLSEAQDKLDQIAADSGKSFRYQIPQLDFELKLKVHTEKKNDGGSGPTIGPRFPLFRVSQATTTEEQTSSNVIKGSVVAVPVHESKPLHILSLASSKMTNGKFEVEATLQSIDGEPQVGVPVEFNIDREETLSVNKESGENQKLLSGTSLNMSVVETDGEGKASVELTFAGSQKKDYAVFLRADALNSSSDLIIKKR